MTWLLLRGLLREQRHWGTFPQVLQGAFPDERIITLDIPGSGRRNREKSPMRIEGMVDHLRQGLSEKGIDTPINLLGISMGGMMVCDWIMSYPQEVNQAVIINSSLKSYSRTLKRLKYQNLPYLAKVIFNPEQRESIILDLVSNRETIKDETSLYWNNLAEQNPISRANGLRQLMAAMRYQPPKNRPQVPTLLLNSAGDRLVDHTCSEDMASIWKSPLVTHPSAGHDLILDDPQWVINNIKKWTQ